MEIEKTQFCCPINIFFLSTVRNQTPHDSFQVKEFLTLLHSEWPKLHRVLAILSAKGLKHDMYRDSLDQVHCHRLT